MIRAWNVKDSQFITSWKTDNAGTSNSDQITLPLKSTGTYNFQVNWGDGTQSTITAYNDAAVTHTYASAGTYTVTIQGTINEWSFAGAGDYRKILNVSRWGCLGFGLSGYQFYGCTNLTITATDIPRFISTDILYGCFYGCTSVTSIPDVENWDVSMISGVGLVGMFTNVPFNQNLSKWDVSNATYLDIMFSGCANFNQDLSVWDYSNKIDLNLMFINSSLTKANYDLLLISLAAQSVQDGVRLGASCHYTAGGAAATARAHLVAATPGGHGWTITDLGAE